MNNNSMIKTSILCGGAGFVGVNLIPSLLNEGRRVLVADNYSNGKEELLRQFAGENNFYHLRVNLENKSGCVKLFEFASSLGGIDEVWHFAANSDIQSGILDPSIDLRDTFLTTFFLLDEIRKHGIACLHFASSSAVYGDLKGQLLHESSGPLLPISNYGAMKLASEALISAAIESFLPMANIFRFPNVVGVPATHGVILDFINKLKQNPSQLEVLGDGTQQKSYLHVSDLIDAMLIIRNREVKHGLELVNIGPTDEGITVEMIARMVVERLSPSAKILFGEGNKGWVGDVPKFKYSTDRIQSYGWKPKLNSREAVAKAIGQIILGVLS
jgi:UDP-glucose 4-epimerase